MAPEKSNGFRNTVDIPYAELTKAEQSRRCCRKHGEGDCGRYCRHWKACNIEDPPSTW